MLYERMQLQCSHGYVVHKAEIVKVMKVLMVEGEHTQTDAEDVCVQVQMIPTESSLHN